MKIAFFSNFINHHQYPVANELRNLPGVDYTFVEIIPMPEAFKKNGYPDYSKEAFVLRAWENDESLLKARQLAVTADVALFGNYLALPYEKLRCKANPKGLSFEVSERWFKRGIINVFSPRFIKWYVNYLLNAKRANVYKLCCSAFVPRDMHYVHAFTNKTYKWGYITKVETFDKECLEKYISVDSSIRILWCARFIKWKHPELVIKMASILKKKGYSFHIDMIGSGEELNRSKELCQSLGVQNCVSFLGNMPNDQVLCEMCKHDIFLFTSDRNEGWGAVLNEAMSRACAVVASNAVGAAPFLIEEGYNGLTFESGNLESLTNKVKYLLDNKQKLTEFKRNAYITMVDIWSPYNASRRLMELIQLLFKGKDSSFKSGPCSKAEII